MGSDEFGKRALLLFILKAGIGYSALGSLLSRHCIFPIFAFVRLDYFPFIGKANRHWDSGGFLHITYYPDLFNVVLNLWGWFHCIKVHSDGL